VSPRFLGISAAILAIAFILALPEAFEGEPADQVDAIKFGPSRSAMEAAERAREASGRPPGRRGSGAPAASALPALPRSDFGVPGDDHGGGQVARADDGDDDGRPGATSQDDEDSGGGGEANDDGRLVRPSSPAPPPPPAPPPIDEDDYGDEGSERLAPGEGEAEVDD
jgi:hypothetical protein